jgi:hypothetical protein
MFRVAQESWVYSSTNSWKSFPMTYAAIKKLALKLSLADRLDLREYILDNLNPPERKKRLHPRPTKNQTGKRRV